MNQAEWLSSDDPDLMLRWLTVTPGYANDAVAPRATDRKLRLFACAACRLVWDQLTDPRSRRAVEVAERFADGLATAEELGLAHYGACNAAPHGTWSAADVAHVCTERQMSRVFNVIRATDADHANIPMPAALAAILRDIFGNPFRPVVVTHGRQCNPYYGSCALDSGHTGEHNAYAIRFDPAVLRWRGGLVVRLAQAAYEERMTEECEKCRGYGGCWYCRFCRGLWPGERTEEGPTCVGCGMDATYDLPAMAWRDCEPCGGTGRAPAGHLDPTRLAVLADAAEEAGVTDEGLLAHLRDKEWCAWCSGRGWWIIDSDPNDHSATCHYCGGRGWTELRGHHVRGCHVIDLFLGRE